MLAHTRESTDAGKPVPRRFRRLRSTPLRDVVPWVAVVVGLLLVVRAMLGRDPGDDPVWLVTGIVLGVLGIVVFFVDRWQARRGHQGRTSTT
jgi:ABC-type enterochelin transport system permease subunit